MSRTVRLKTDAFSRGQVQSKIWAAEKLEWCVEHHELGPLNVYILGGWYALLFFILKSRNNIKIDKCRSFDIDPVACSAANDLNECWVAEEWAFRSQPQDINTLVYDDATINCVINTSTEHMTSNAWWDNIPAGMLCLLQSNDLELDDHVNGVEDIDTLKIKYPLSEVFYEGIRYIDGYHRYMIIGKK